MRVAIEAGHSPANPGALPWGANPPVANEHAWTAAAALALHGACLKNGLESAVFSRARFGSSRAMVEAINAWAPHAVVSLHLNANPIKPHTRKGALGLYWPGSKDGATLALSLADAAALATGNPRLGVLPQGKAWQDGDTAASGPTGAPLLILQATRAPAAILEAAFVDQPTDLAAAVAALRSGALARSLALALVTWGHTRGLVT